MVDCQVEIVRCLLGIMNGRKHMLVHVKVSIIFFKVLEINRDSNQGKEFEIYKDLSGSSFNRSLRMHKDIDKEY